MESATLLENLPQIRKKAFSDLENVTSLKELEKVRIKYLGRHGQLSKLIKKISQLEKSERVVVGKKINLLKNKLEKEITIKKKELSRRLQEKEWFDFTKPIYPNKGSLHLISQAIREIINIFSQLGFVQVFYPEIEWDWYAFESLNMPPGHPARDEWETFFIDAPKHPRYGRLLLTPHTSNGQVRELKRLKKPPVRMINIARCYRRQQDRTHTPMFHQFEGLVVDKDINLTHLKGTIDYFAKKFYGKRSKSRFRPFHFQFTEPSLEVDFSCVHCNAKGCHFCKSGWHEVGGAGMVHPVVLKNGGFDPQKYRGFAFGWGIERTLSLHPDIQINDIRMLYENDIRFLKQF